MYSVVFKSMTRFVLSLVIALITMEVSMADVSEKKLEARKKELTQLQYEVTQQCGTEPPFKNEYWNNNREGIYVDIVSGSRSLAQTISLTQGVGGLALPSR